MKNQYIVECKCINENNDFGLEVGQIGYYNTDAQSFKYQTKRWSTVGWDNWSSYKIREQNDGGNPYFGLNLWKYNIPVTSNIDHAAFFKNLATAQKIAEDIEKIGDFACKILVVKTIIEPYE